MRQILKGGFWFAVYLGLVLAPLLLLLVGPAPPGRGFWIDFSLALGFAGAAMLAVQFILTARFIQATAPFGIDVIYYFHRVLAVAAVLFVLLHPAILIIEDPSLVVAMNPFNRSWAMLLGEAAAILLLVVAVTSLWRKQLNLGYRAWRRMHWVLSGVALALTLAHIRLCAYYTMVPWKQALWMAILASWLGVVVFVRVVRPWRLRRRPWTVARVSRERGSTWTVVLQADGHAGMKFQPGQFVWMWLGASPFTMKEHPFSIASSPTVPTSVSLAIKELGNFTRMIGTTRPGTRAYLEGPYGAFSIDRHPAPGAVFVAGGIGIAPIMSMLRALADRGDRRPLLLIYGNRLWERAAFREELADLTGRLNLRVVHVIEEPECDWTGERGMPDQSLLERHLPANRRELDYFICGPTPMNEAMERSLHRLGVPLHQIHTELFDLV